LSRSNHDAERQRKLAAMMQDANAVESERRDRLARLEAEERTRDQEEQARRSRHYHHSERSSFIRDAEYQAYSSANAMDLSERMRRNRAQLARIADD